MKKLIVYVGKNKEDVLKTLLNDGEILANYGESVLLQTDDAGFQRVQDQNIRFRELETKPLLTMGAFELDTDNVAMRSTSNAASLMGLTTMLNEKSHYIIRLAGPMHPDWKKELEKMSVGFLETIQEDFYLVDIDMDKVDDVQNLPYVESISNYEPELKISPSLVTSDLMNVLSSKNGLTVLNIDLSANTDNDETNILSQFTQRRKLYDPKTEGNIEIVSFLQIIAQPFISQVEQAGANVIKVIGNRIIAFTDTSSIPEIAKIQEVKEINPYQPFQNQNNVASGIIRADVLQNNHGLNGAGQIVAVADTGLDTGVNDASMMNDFSGRIVQIFPLGRPGNASDPDGHGTHVAGSVLGNGANSNGNVRGVAPNARLVFQSLLDPAGGLGGIPADLSTLFQQALDNGANIHTNSWVAPVNGSYNSDSSEADTFTFNNSCYEL